MEGQVVSANANANAQDDQSIFIKTLTGKSIHVSYDQDMTILSIKQEITKVEQIPVEQQRLIFSGKQLEDDKTLRYYNIPSGSTVHLVLRLRG